MRGIIEGILWVVEGVDMKIEFDPVVRLFERRIHPLPTFIRGSCLQPVSGYVKRLSRGLPGGLSREAIERR
jgi:hypothetical protein